MENMDTFYRRNDIGVNIEYTVIGYYNNKYMIYTDFTTDTSNKIGIALYVDKIENGNYKKVPEDERKNILKAFNKEVTSINKG